MLRAFSNYDCKQELLNPSALHETWQLTSGAYIWVSHIKKSHQASKSYSTELNVLDFTYQPFSWLIKRPAATLYIYFVEEHKG